MREDQFTWVRTGARRLSRRAVIQAGTAGAGLAALAAAGCGSTAKSGGAAKPAGGLATASDPGLKASNFKTGGTLQLQLNTVIGLDPYTNSSFVANQISSHHYSRLFRYVAGLEPSVFLSHEVVPDLVDSYEISPDGATYTLRLRKDAMFHPPLSRTLTSADVLASWQRFTSDPRSVNGVAFTPFVDSLTAPDDRTLSFKLKAPYGPYLKKLANPSYFWIMSKEAADGKVDPNKQAIGTGPWIFVGSTPTSYSYRKNPDYYIKGIPYADGAVHNVMLDFAQREAQFQAGKIDVDFVPLTDVEAMQKAVPKAHVVHYNDSTMEYLFFYNVSSLDSPFSDIRVRRAASLAVDRKGLLDAGYNGQGPWANLVSPWLGKWWLDPQGKEIGDTGKWFKHDPAQARQLLAAAGHANTQFKFIYSNNSYGDIFNLQADAVRGMLADAGFKLSVVTVDYQKDYIASGDGIFFKGGPPNSIVYARGPGRFPDADEYLNALLSPDGNRNPAKVNDPNLTALLKKEQAEPDEDKRLDLVKQLQKAANEQMWYAPCTGVIRYDFYQPWIDNPIVSSEFSYGLERHAYLSTNRT